MFYNTLSVLLLALFSSVALGGEIHIATQQWIPYHYQKDGKTYGDVFPILNCVFKSIGHKATYHFLPWARAQHLTEKGEMDGFMLASNNNARDRYAVRSVPLLDQSYVIYYKKVGSKTVSLDEIRSSALLGVRLSTNMESWSKKNGFKVFSPHNSIEQMLGLIDDGRVEFYLENQLVFEAAVKRTSRSMSNYNSIYVKHSPLGVYFGKSFLSTRPNFLKRFNEAAEKCIID